MGKSFLKLYFKFEIKNKQLNEFFGQLLLRGFLDASIRFNGGESLQNMWVLQVSNSVRRGCNEKEVWECFSGTEAVHQV